MAIEALVARYGLIAIFAGAGIEGEAVVITGGVLAQKGLLPIWGVAAAAAAGSCLIDQLWFWMARRYRDHRRVRAVMARPAFARAIRLLERYPTSFILAFRWIYGLRTVSPMAIGTSAIRSRTFVPLNIVSAAFWGPAIAWAGYAFGKALDPWLHDVKSVVLGALALGGGIALVLLLVRWHRAAVAG
ncbi:VTT domain-containing protein [Sphingomonas sp. BIUV-7]|uniref:VTT domain-containing protein n=1 Tax=Sphingomonas natans TaxID=3063330 RepID=A0ABT8Y546_9SPHN|nr:VTT domain-containing protein [Sphingomonas sp. BIUV-7]MDO6412785.1 VTT domain-containing protein [Sphingomonas sp. BIUV-7]